MFLCLVFLTAITWGASEVQLAVINADNRPLRYAAVTLARSIGGLAFGVTLAFLFRDDVITLVGTAAGFGLALFLAGVNRDLVKSFSLSTQRINSSLVLLRYGGPLALGALGLLLVNYFDRFYIAALFGAAAAGTFVASYALVEQAIGSIANVLYLSSMPGVISAHENGDHEKVQRRLEHLRQTMLLFLPPLAMLFVASPQEYTRLLLGAVYGDGAREIAPALAFAMLCSVFKISYFDIVMLLHRRTTYIALTALGMAAANIALNLVLTPSLGLRGAAFSCAAAYFGGLIASVIAARRFGQADFRIYAISIACCAGQLVLMRALPMTDSALGLGLAAVAGLVFYATFFLMMTADKSFLRRELRKLKG